MTVAAAGLLAVSAGCGAHQDKHAAQTRPAHQLLRPHPCPGVSGFTCAWLVVPVDHAGPGARTLRLAVGVQAAGAAPRGVLLLLTGGPGQPGVSLIPRIGARLGSTVHGYRLVMFDQRGTGAGALSCPALQAAAGSSDLVVPPPGAVANCARAIGPDRRYFTTPETVADIEQLRVALGVARLTLDGISYGTYVAERYALTYPQHVTRIVLDSVVPQRGVDPLYVAALGSTARVLRDVCAQQRCGWDPALDVRAIVRQRHDGPELLNALVAESVASPSFAGVLGVLHSAAAGHPAGLQRFLDAVRRGEAATATQLSQGLHESTLCLDLQSPWRPGASPGQRTAALTRTADRLRPADVFPFDRATAFGNGLAQGCLQWPATRPPGLPDGKPTGPLPHVPVLLLSGARDLSTPLQWAREEAARAPDGRLVVVPGAGHSVQTRAANPAARALVARFLAG